MLKSVVEESVHVQENGWGSSANGSVFFPQQTDMTNTSNSTSRVSSQYNSPKELLQLAASGLRNPGQVAQLWRSSV